MGAVRDFTLVLRDGKLTALNWEDD